MLDAVSAAFLPTGMHIPPHEEDIRPEWIDANGHMNLAYYIVVFDHALDTAFHALGIGWDYRGRTEFSTFAAETHTLYEREVKVGERVRVLTRTLAVDAKRLHLFQEMHHAREGHRLAAHEQMCLHVDLRMRRVAPWPEDRRALLEAAVRAEAQRPPPEGTGRRIAMPSTRV
jgi:acyl-CoA thioester hydrolase